MNRLRLGIGALLVGMPALILITAAERSPATMATAATRFLASRNPADAATARAELAGMNQALEVVKAGTAENRRVQRFTQAIAEPAAQFDKALAGLMATTDRIAQNAAAREAAGRELLASATTLRDSSLMDQKAAVEAMQAAVTSARTLGLDSPLAEVPAIARLYLTPTDGSLG